MIKKIKIINIKGIGENTENSEIKFDLLPNKTTILVAPNGYGKSSLAIAFKSLNPTKIILDDGHSFKANNSNLPKIEITYLNEDNDEIILNATNSSNTINSSFDCFVINNQIFAKAKKNKIGSAVIASASLETAPIILINKIPENYYLLGVIYNGGLHWKDINEFSLGNKLENLVIKRMIREL
ncbi:hypothetical protein [Chryseobacterium sp. T20]|uniref:hypothetical protein n=1 Tax=Chryseobacterium sp. T20 TaxID=3395375 RepID=UPI0039BC7895